MTIHPCSLLLPSPHITSTKTPTDLAGYLKSLEAHKPVVLCGDLNCAPQPIDIHDPKRNLKSAGYTPEERESFATHLLGGGFVDAFRCVWEGGKVRVLGGRGGRGTEGG
jgi:exonuclease III